MLVAGWDEGPEFAQILRSDRDIYNTSQPLSLHAFDVSFDPVAAGLCGRRVALSGTGGLPLPVETAQRLNLTPQGELTWNKVTVDPSRGPSFLDSDFDFCTVIPGCLQGGRCRASCTPSEVKPPEPPKRGCPAGWRDLGDPEMEFCFPELWIENNIATSVAPMECPGDQHDLDGSCVALGPCADGPFAEPPSDAGAIAYVSSSAAPMGDGSSSRPFDTLEGALANSDDVVMLAAGSYTLGPSVDIGSRRLIGVCVDQVRVETDSLTVTEEASISGLSLLGVRTAVVVRGGRLSISGVSIESPGAAVLVNANGTLTSTQSRLRRIASADSPDLAAVSVVTSTATLHSTSIEGILSARGSDVSLSHFSLVSTDRFNAAIAAVATGLTLTRGRVLSRRQVALSAKRGTKPLVARDLFVSSVASKTMVIEGPDSGQNFVRLAIASRGSSGAAIEIRQSVAQFTDYALFGGGPALEVSGLEDAPRGFARGVVNGAWLNIGGRIGFLAKDTSGGIDIQDMWLDGLPEPNVATDEYSSCILQRAFQGSVRRARIRPRGRHGIVADELGRLIIEDIDIIGEHGRSLWIVPGSQILVNRLRASDSAGLDGSDFGRPGLRSVMSDVELEVTAEALEVLGGAFFVQGQPEIDPQRFVVRGPFSVNPALQAGGLVMVDGTIDAPTVEWPASFIDQLSQVKLLLPAAVDSPGCAR